MTGNSGAVDLFGLPVIERAAKRGRPEHVRSAENANKISLLFALGRSVADAAKALGITQPTLRKHYFSEVEQREAMATRLEADQLLSLHDQARDGNVSAMKELLARLDKAMTAKLSESLPRKRTTEARKGKKEEAQEAATSVAGLYATREPPSLMN